ncbi:putative metal-binding membrane protein [Paraburkholderia sp. GAS199]|uniref:DUF2182 domain-containing protein n=1 Tax=Paraburkholderia sp. GAS199 TaxID=3035126 RepID=UPI003D1E2145
MSGVGAVRDTQTQERCLVGVASLVFVTCAAATVVCCTAMSAKGGVPMPGGWTMSMAWLRMCGQTWQGAAASFVGMWIVMMVTMMLPALLPVLVRYRSAPGGSVRLTLAAAAGYFGVWLALGVVVFPLGTAVAAVEMRVADVARLAPLVSALVVVAAGVFQGGGRKMRCLKHFPALSADAGLLAAARSGAVFGLHCLICCAGFTAILLAVGVMNLGLMALMTAAITAERILPDRERVARLTGYILVAAGGVGMASAWPSVFLN